MKTLALLLALGTTVGASAAAEPLLPLPDAPVVLVSADPAALDRALTGGLRKALSGEGRCGGPRDEGAPADARRPEARRQPLRGRTSP